MGFQLSHQDGTLEEALRRIACEQIDKALGSIEHDDWPEAIHNVRRRCKMLRGLIRLVRTAFDDFGEEDTAFRDVAKPLSALRDAKVMLDTIERIGEQAEGKHERRLIRAIHEDLARERKALAETADDAALLGEARGRLEQARRRAREWRLDNDGWRVVGEGVAITYAHAREDIAAAMAGRAPELFHEARKHVRYHWCHARLLRPLWPEQMEARAQLADELADLLGFHHDLFVLTGRLESDAGRFGPHDKVAPVLALISRESAALEARAGELAGRLFAETPEALIEHWHALWSNWQEAGGAADGS